MKKKIAILGGGMAGLSAAYQLTRTPELRAQHDVTVYQMGWRLGGKVASSRDECDRNLEHGLHVWFGCYHNVFRLTQELYAQWQKPAGCPLQAWTDVAKPQDYTPLGVEQDGRWSYFPLTWPRNGGIPGQGGLDMTPHEALTTLLGWIEIAIRGSVEEWTELWSEPKAGAALPAPPSHKPLPDAFAALAGSSALDAGEVARARQLFARSRFGVLALEQRFEAASLWTKALQATPRARVPADAEQLLELYAGAEAAYDAVMRALPAGLAPAQRERGVKLRIIGEVVHLFGALLRGFVRELIVPDSPFEALDDRDFRAWLVQHGASSAVVAKSSVVHALYDTMFQYADGDLERPSYAAGSALGSLLRLIATFKGAVMWNVQAGMGEAVVAPLYDVLRANGVAFRFFRKVRRLELSGSRVSRIQLEVQARTKGGAAYRATRFQPECKLWYWPIEPDWDQLEDGEALQRSRANFESHWYTAANPQYEQLEAGKDFDAVVLAIALGAYKPLNEERGMCADLIAASSRFADFATKMELVPSQCLQLWSDWTAEELGWRDRPAAMVSGPQYLNIWDDMSQLLAFERWPCATKPKTLYYLTGTYKTQLHKQPSTSTGTPAVALAELRAQTVEWLRRSAYVMWPNACDGTAFRYDVLTDPLNRVGEARLDAQFLRANVDPTECCVGSAAGTTQYRLQADESGFDNLVLAGEATRHGFNTTTIEGAVMSGMAAARAICGEPATIVGYDFLRSRPSQRVR